jgi:hypothetical protein
MFVGITIVIAALAIFYLRKRRARKTEQHVPAQAA